MLIAVAIAFFCTLGQGIDSWICFGVYLGVGVVIWLWMCLLYTSFMRALYLPKFSFAFLC